MTQQRAACDASIIHFGPFPLTKEDWQLVLFLGRLFDTVDLIKPVSNVRRSVPTYVPMSVRPYTKSFFDFSELWHVGRGR